MLAIVRITGGIPTGWIVATDMDDARRQVYAAGDQELAQAMPTSPENTMPAKQEIAPGCWLLRT